MLFETHLLDEEFHYPSPLILCFLCLLLLIHLPTWAYLSFLISLACATGGHARQVKGKIPHDSRGRSGGLKPPWLAEAAFSRYGR